jgi:hypothetical protein
LNTNWVSTLGWFHGDVESMWNKFKQMLEQAIEINVPKLNSFSSWKKSKWKRPVGREIAYKKSIELGNATLQQKI